MVQQGNNTLYCEIKCPRCGHNVASGIGFRVGAVNQSSYQLGQKIIWEGAHVRPSERPTDGNLKTIGYFECDNLKCDTWQDCFPEVQEAMITIKADVIAEAKPCTHSPNDIRFDIIDFNE
jgi:hypothetical protein